MPIKIQSDLPAREKLLRENIFVMDEDRALSQDIRPLLLLVVNLMPVKQETELQLLRALSNTPLQIDVSFMQMLSHKSRNTDSSHIAKFYRGFDSYRHKKFDGMIITGAPVEQMKFEDVDYWQELCEVMDWSVSNVTSTFHICWGAQAALYHHYGISKRMLDKKLVGVFSHKTYNRKNTLLRGFDDVFLAPHSRYTTISRKDIESCEKLTLLADSDNAGPLLVASKDEKQVFVLGHLEYDRKTLDGEYRRDLAKGISAELPLNYYPDDDPDKFPVLTWRSHCNNLYTNWLNYYVYQITPYVLSPSLV